MLFRTVIALGEAVLGYFCTSLGFVLQKKGIGWLGFQGRKGPGYYRDLWTWGIGFALLNLAVLPNYLSLGVLNAYIVNAISGLNIVFMIFLSRWILNEPLHPQDYLYTLIMCAAIVGINLADGSGASVSTIQADFAYLAAAIPVGSLFIWFLLRVAKVLRPTSGLQALWLAPASGSMSGLMITYMKILQLERGTQLLSYLGSPYLYCFFTVSALSMVAIQMAYRMGSMILVCPAQFATTVFYPILAAYPIFSLPVNPVQVVCFIAIVTTVVLMVKDHARE